MLKSEMDARLRYDRYDISEKQIVVKAAYVVLGVNMDDEKEVLEIWIGANESSKFWLSVINGLKNRGVQNILIFCADGLNGFKEAIPSN